MGDLPKTTSDPSDAASDPHHLEKRWTEMLLRRLRGGGKMVLGTFAEVVVADRLQGSELATLGTESVDLVWNGIDIHVKCTTQTPPKWSLGKAFAAEANPINEANPHRCQVYVFARLHGQDHLAPECWGFHVVPRSWLATRGTLNVRLGTISEEFPEVRGDALAEAVARLGA